MSSQHTAVERFIEDAISGGYEADTVEMRHWKRMLPDLNPIDQARLISRMLLDPLAWQAMYKIRGCPGTCNGDVRKPACAICGGWGSSKDPRPHMHRFIDLLADGHSIEESLKSLEV